MKALLIIGIAVCLYWLLSATLDHYARRWVLSHDEEYQVSLEVFVSLAQVFLFMTTVYIIFRCFGVDVAGLLASFSLFSALIGITLQVPLTNLAAGLLLSYMKTYQEGNQVQIEVSSCVKIGPATIIKFGPQFVTVQYNVGGQRANIPNLLFLTCPVLRTSF
jgi:small-conductance mechanosensitive channel